MLVSRLPQCAVEKVELYLKTRDDAIPKQEVTKGASKEDPLADLSVGDMTVEAIAESIGKTARGVKTMLTRRGLTASDYDGAAKKEKASA